MSRASGRAGRDRRSMAAPLQRKIGRRPGIRRPAARSADRYWPSTGRCRGSPSGCAASRPRPRAGHVRRQIGPSPKGLGGGMEGAGLGARKAKRPQLGFAGRPAHRPGSKGSRRCASRAQIASPALSEISWSVTMRSRLFKPGLGVAERRQAMARPRPAAKRGSTADEPVHRRCKIFRSVEALHGPV